MKNPDGVKQALSGVSAVAATPFTSDYELDMPGLSSNVDLLADSGVDTIVTCGGTGEYLSLTSAEATAVTRTITATVRGRVPVIGAVGGPIADARATADLYSNIGVDAILIHHPYQPYVSTLGIVDYYRSVAQGANLPVILYIRSPLLDWTELQSLASEQNIIGVKYAVEDLRLVSRLGARVSNELGWAFVCGLAEGYAAPYARLGARGFTSGIANFAPAISIGFRDSLSTDPGGAPTHGTEVEAFERLRADSNGAYNIAAIKEAMSQSGLAAGPVRPPGADLPTHLKSAVREYVDTWRARTATSARQVNSDLSSRPANGSLTDGAPGLKRE